MVTVTELLKAEGFIDTTWFDDYSRDRGTFVHRAVHLYDTDELNEAALDLALIPYLDAWKRFLKESKFEVIESEVRINNGQFTGMPDKVGLLNGVPTILDNKTGSIMPYVALQLAGYEILKGGHYKRVAIRLKDDGTYSLKEFKDRQDRGVFLAALSCYQWKNNNIKGRG